MLLIVARSSTAQNWTWQNPLPQGSNLYSVCFPDTNTGYSVGADGVILKTTNGGLSWTLQNSGTTNTLLSVYFTDADTGYAAGTSATLLKTTNGGANWSYVTIYQSYELYSLYFTDAQTGYAAGRSGKILKTTNGGANWSILTSGTPINLRSVCFTATNQGYAVGENGIMLKTTDAGVTWTPFSGSAYYADLNGVYFPNACTGYAVGNQGAILKTSSGGAQWTTQNSLTTNNLRSVFFPTDVKGYAVGDTGKIITTNDGGTTWVTQTSGTSNTLYSVCFVNSDTGFAVGNSGTILKTINGGTSWTLQTSGVTNILTSVQFINDSTGFAAGTSGRIIKTTNGGTTWSILYSGTTLDLKTVNFPTPDTGYVAGVSGHIRKTVNGGTNWTQLSNNINYVITSLSFIDGTKGYAVGYDYNGNGQIYKTVNGGVNWTVQTISSEHDLLSVQYADANTVFIAGENGTILRTILGAASATTSYVVICEGVPLTLSASSVSGATYLWTGPNGFTSTMQNPTVSTHATDTMSGTYTVSATMNGCTSLTEITMVIVHPSPAKPAAGNNGPVCEGAPLTLSASTVQGASYQWTGPGGFGSTQQNPTVGPAATLAMGGTYYVSATKDGCTSTADSTIVAVHPIPSAPTAGNNGPVGLDSLLTLSASTISGAGYSWTGPAGFTSSVQNPVVSTQATLAMAGMYEVTATVNGCTSLAGSTLVIVDPTMGMSDEKPKTEICLYPNPASEMIMIKTGMQSARMQIFNTPGACVVQYDLNGTTNRIDLRSLAPGIYLIRLTGTDGTIERKLIKK